MRKIFCIIIWMCAMPSQGLFAYFSMDEESSGVFTAGTVAITIIPSTHSSGISGSFSPVFGFTVQQTGTHAPHYRLSATTTGAGCDVNDFYHQLEVEILGPQGLYHQGTLAALDLFGDIAGAWSMRVAAGDDMSAYLGEQCMFQLVVEAWQQGFVYGTGGFTDTKIAQFTLTAVDTIGQQDTLSVVLNELYPNEIATTTSPLDQEWVELYNGTDSPIDIEGWQLGELAGGSGVETVHTISASHTCATGAKVGYARPYEGSTTVIPSKGLLVVVFCAQGRMYNSGDTITLYNENGAHIDSYMYPSTPAGKSHARIPDGGTWIDPVPSPGITNMETITKADLVLAGWDTQRITQVLPEITMNDAATHSSQRMSVSSSTATTTADISTAPAGRVLVTSTSTASTTRIASASTTVSVRTHATSGSARALGDSAASTSPMYASTTMSSATSTVDTMHTATTALISPRKHADGVATTTVEVFEEEAVLLDEHDDIEIPALSENDEVQEPEVPVDVGIVQAPETVPAPVSATTILDNEASEI